MTLCDVNVLVYSHRRDAVDHERYRDWLLGAMESELPFGVSALVLSALVRIVTHPRIFREPSSLAAALSFCADVRGRPGCVMISPGPGHWRIFSELCESVEARGNAVPDAYLAALAIESGCEWITTDRSFARFPGLRTRHPLG